MLSDIRTSFTVKNPVVSLKTSSLFDLSNRLTETSTVFFTCHKRSIRVACYNCSYLTGYLDLNLFLSLCNIALLQREVYCTCIHIFCRELKVTAPGQVMVDGKSMAVVHMNHSYQYVQEGECV